MHVYDTARVHQEVDDPHRARTGGQRPTMTTTPNFGSADPNGGWWTPYTMVDPRMVVTNAYGARQMCHTAMV